MSTEASWAGVVSSSVRQLLGGSARGAVHSLFEHSFNVEFEEGLLNVQPIEGQLAAFGIKLESAVVHDLIRNLKRGDMVRHDGDRLRFYPTYGLPMTVRLDTLDVKELSVPAGEMSAEDNMVLQKAIEDLDLEGRLGIENDDAFRRHTGTLAAGEPSDEEMQAAIAWLVGRGTGLTPGGDDILTGYAFWLFARADMEPDPEILRMMEGRTTEISVTFMRMLSRGFTSEYYRDLCIAVADRSQEEMQHILHQITRIGHSSGRDSLFGMGLATQRMAAVASGTSLS